MLKMGNGAALDFICRNVCNYLFVKRLSLEGQFQADDENAFKKIVECMKNNKSIKVLDLNLDFTAKEGSRAKCTFFFHFFILSKYHHHLKQLQVLKSLKKLPKI